MSLRTPLLSASVNSLDDENPENTVVTVHSQQGSEIKESHSKYGALDWWESIIPETQDMDEDKQEESKSSPNPAFPSPVKTGCWEYGISHPANKSCLDCWTPLTLPKELGQDVITSVSQKSLYYISCCFEPLNLFNSCYISCSSKYCSATTAGRWMCENPIYCITSLPLCTVSRCLHFAALSCAANSIYLDLCISLSPENQSMDALQRDSFQRYINEENLIEIINTINQSSFKSYEVAKVFGKEIAKLAITKDNVPVDVRNNLLLAIRSHGIDISDMGENIKLAIKMKYKSIDKILTTLVEKTPLRRRPKELPELIGVVLAHVYINRKLDIREMHDVGKKALILINHGIKDKRIIWVLNAYKAWEKRELVLRMLHKRENIYDMTVGHKFRFNGLQNEFIDKICEFVDGFPRVNDGHPSSTKPKVR